MSRVEWGDPPKRTRNSETRTATVEAANIAAALGERPGAWACVWMAETRVSLEPLSYVLKNQHGLETTIRTRRPEGNYGLWARTAKSQL